MNYRHAYHAGNFADVVKHVILSRVLTYMKLKPLPFRVIDTHAGCGTYDLEGVEPNKTGEWKDGIGRLLDCDIPADAALLLQPYLAAVASVNAAGVLKNYPGSPVIARFLMRPSDHLVANELHADDFLILKSTMDRTADTKVLNLDAWLAVKSLLPPPERRGVILIDPPFEKPDEFAALTQATAEAIKRFATGVYIIWYPVKRLDLADRFTAAAAKLGSGKMLDIRLSVAEPFAGLGLTQTGIAIINPPFNLRAELECLMPFLVDCMGQQGGAGFGIVDVWD